MTGATSVPGGCRHIQSPSCAMVGGGMPYIKQYLKSFGWCSHASGTLTQGQVAAAEAATGAAITEPLIQRPWRRKHRS
jgi:hypothetical protein